MSGGACPCCGASVSDSAAITGFDRLQGTPGEFPVTICSSCGAGITLPQLPPEELARFYPETYGPYDAVEHGVTARISRAIQLWEGNRALRSQPLRPLTERPPGRLVDVGCGRGDLGAFLIGRGWTVTGIEPSPAACETARARGIDARRGTADEVELEPDGYDAGVFRHSLEHVTDPVAVLRRIREALRPGALVLISVPNFGSWQRRRFGSRWFHLDLPRHRVHFTEAALTHTLERSGFEPQGLSTSTSPVGLPASIQYALVGRCVFPSGLRLRIAAGLCVLSWPPARVLDGLGGGGDVLNAVARRRE